MTSTSPKSAETFHALDRLPGFVWVYDPDEDRTVWISSSWYGYSGVPRDTSVEDTLARVIHPEDLPTMQELWSLHRTRGAAYTSVARYRAVDGRYRHHRYTARPVGGLWYGVAVEVEREAQALAASVSAMEVLAVARASVTATAALTQGMLGLRRQNRAATALLVATILVVAALVIWVLISLGVPPP